MNTIDGLKYHDSILSKLDTFKRKKRARQEVEELTKESSDALQNAMNSLVLDDPNDFKLQEGEERSFIHRESLKSPNVKQLCEKLIQWVNNELADERIIVRDLCEDLYDGQILQILVEKLGNLKLAHPELTQSEFGQLQRLREVLHTVTKMLPISLTHISKWTPERIYNKDLVAILSLLVSLSHQFNPNLMFQPGTYLTVIKARKMNHKLELRYERVYVTDETGAKPGLQHALLPDARTLSPKLCQFLNPSESPAEGHPWDTFADHQMVRQTLLAFVNTHLVQLSLQVADIGKDFSDGVLLILLVGLLEGYFVPFYAYHPTPTSEEMRLTNVRLAFDLIDSAGVSNLPAQPEEIVSCEDNGRAIHRVLYSLWLHYTHLQEPDTPDDNLTGDTGYQAGDHTTSRGQIDYIREVEEDEVATGGE